MILSLHYDTRANDRCYPLYTYYLPCGPQAVHLWQAGQFGRGSLSRSKPLKLLQAGDIGYKQQQYMNTEAQDEGLEEVLIFDPFEIHYLRWTLGHRMADVHVDHDVFPFYHHFRASGDVPKSGLLYAADFVLYPLQNGHQKRHQHGSHLVTIVKKDEAPPSWLDVLGMIRIATNANKVLHYFHEMAKC